MTLGIKIAIGAALLLILTGSYFLWRGTQRGIGVTTGESNIKNQDQAASAANLKQAQAQTEAMRQTAVAAARVGIDEHRKLIDYIAAHPVGAIRVCVSAAPNNRNLRVPNPAAAVGGPRDPSAGFIAGSAVPVAVPVATSNDLAPALNTIVRGFGTVVGLYRQCQSRLSSPGELK